MLLLIPVAVVAAVIGATWGYAQQLVRRGDGEQARTHYAVAAAAYQQAIALAHFPPFSGVLDSAARRARTGLLSNDLRWAGALSAAGRYPEARARLDAARSASTTASERDAARDATAALLLQWAGYLEAQKAYPAAIEQLRQVARFDPRGDDASAVQVALARNTVAEGARLDALKKFREALPWYRDAVGQFDGTEAAATARAAIPHALYEQALLDVQARAYEQARAEMGEVVRDYPNAPTAQPARDALAAAQPLTGRTVAADHSAVPNLQVRVVTKWQILRPGVYDDSLGAVFLGTSDGEGRFSILLPPGENYLVTWWSPSRNTFMTTFTPDFTDSANKVTVLPLQPASADDLPVS